MMSVGLTGYLLTIPKLKESWLKNEMFHSKETESYLNSVGTFKVKVIRA